MPLYIQDRIILTPYLPPYFKLELLSAIFSAIAYGIVVVLFGNCFYLLQRKRDIYPNRMRITLPIYVIVMLLSSTWSLTGSICSLMNNLTPKKFINPFFHRSFALPVTVTMWGADGFMVRILIMCQKQRFTMQLQIWRCLVLYQEVSRGLRIGIIVFLSLISFASFGRPISISIQIPHKNL